MVGINKLFVSILLEGNEMDVGELVLSKGKIYFKFHNDYLQNGFNLSPFKLPFTSDIVSADRDPFEGLFGVFNDSLPDGWGRLLLDRFLSEKGINIANITPPDRLDYVGSGGMGALVYKPEIEHGRFDDPIPELDTIATEMNQILRGDSSEIIEELLILGGSSGGARPKNFVAFNPSTGDLINGINHVPEGLE